MPTHKLFFPAETADINVNDAKIFLAFCLYSGNGTIQIDAPTFSIDGRTLRPTHPEGEATEPVTVFDSVQERCFSFGFAEAPELRLDIVAQTTCESPVIRFRYVLHSETLVRLTKPDGKDALTYFTLDFSSFGDDPQKTHAKELRFSEFSHLFHTFAPTEVSLRPEDFQHQRTLMGPMLVIDDGTEIPTALIAYEHGSQLPDNFLAYRLHEDGRRISLSAVKGNYYDGQVIGPETPFESVWFQIAAVDNNEETLARAYREWVLKYQTPNKASRTPYIFYNTWNYQERVFHWQKKPYLAEMTEARMLAEIEVARRMGIDVFVIDTGWYEKTGDWQVSSARFPNGLKPITDKLNAYGMKLGLWFNPTVAAVSSQMRREHEDCLMTRNGKPHDPHPVWETEESQGISLVSRYWEAFADELIRLNREVGVTYFKWDAIGQYGSDAANHFHGTEANSAQERRDCYGFLLGEYMTKVVNKVCAACPEAIVDFDITEGGRTVGLQFLSAGKYFLINNGPYNHDYNMPVPADGNVNLFFFPGPARAWICRKPLEYDRWIPSVLFLTHYLPDPDYSADWGNASFAGENLWITLASLVLGQNGIWGDLVALPEDAIATYGTALGLYKQIRDDITAAYPFRTGAVGGSPEIHEKIHETTGRGVVSLFADAAGTYTYVTNSPVADGIWRNHGVTVTRDAKNRAVITAEFKPGEKAKIVFFGVDF